MRNEGQRDGSRSMKVEITGKPVRVTRVTILDRYYEVSETQVEHGPAGGGHSHLEALLFRMYGRFGAVEGVGGRGATTTDVLAQLGSMRADKFRRLLKK